MNRSGGIEMDRTRKSGARFPLQLVGLSAVAIGLGIMKIYLHYDSRFRSGLLDYLVGVGAILGGIFLFSRKPSKVVLLISGSFIAVEVFKAIVDRHDLFDVSLASVAVIYLIIPLLRFILQHGRSRQLD